MTEKLYNVRQIIERLSLSVFGCEFNIRCEHDCIDGGRIFVQVIYFAPCTKTGHTEEWRGRKWYLSSFMTDDEVVKTCYAAFEAAVKHEVMEGFKVDGIVLFNPHINFETLLRVSADEVKREVI